MITDVKCQTISRLWTPGGTHIRHGDCRPRIINYLREQTPAASDRNSCSGSVTVGPLSGQLTPAFCHWVSSSSVSMPIPTSVPLLVLLLKFPDGWEVCTHLIGLVLSERLHFLSRISVTTIYNFWDGEYFVIATNTVFEKKKSRLTLAEFFDIILFYAFYSEHQLNSYPKYGPHVPYIPQLSR